MVDITAVETLVLAAREMVLSTMAEPVPADHTLHHQGIQHSLVVHAIAEALVEPMVAAVSAAHAEEALLAAHTEVALLAAHTEVAADTLVDADKRRKKE